jgi:hypothetical protein
MAAIVNALRRRGFRRGVMGDSRAWLTIWALLAAGKVVRRIVGHKPEVVYKETLAPGQTLVIAHATEVVGVEDRRADAKSPAPS